jgi:hypothetical protein
MFRQEDDELNGGELADYPLLQLLIFYPETHLCLCNVFESMLRDGRASSISPRISQEVSLGLKIIHMNAPPSILIC